MLSAWGCRCIMVCACAESWMRHPNFHAAGDIQFCLLTHESGGATRKAKFLVVGGTSERARRWLGMQGKHSMLIVPDLHYSKSCKHPVHLALLHPCGFVTQKAYLTTSFMVVTSQ